VLVRYGLQRVHVTSAAIQMSWYEGPGPRRHRGFHSRRVDQVIGPALYRDGRGAGEVDGCCCGDHGMRAKDNLVASSDAGRTKCNEEPVRRVGHTEAISDAQEPSQAALELRQIPLHDEGAATPDIGDQPQDWTFEYEVVAADGDLGVMTGTTVYKGNPGTFSNVWLIRLANDGRCKDFREWFVRKRE